MGFSLFGLFVGHRWEHLRGGLGFLQAWHIFWDQRSEGAETSQNLQDHQVSLGYTGNLSHTAGLL